MSIQYVCVWHVCVCARASMSRMSFGSHEGRWHFVFIRCLSRLGLPAAVNLAMPQRTRIDELCLYCRLSAWHSYIILRLPLLPILLEYVNTIVLARACLCECAWVYARSTVCLPFACLSIQSRHLYTSIVCNGRSTDIYIYILLCVHSVASTHRFVDILKTQTHSGRFLMANARGSCATHASNAVATRTNIASANASRLAKLLYDVMNKYTRDALAEYAFVTVN